MEWLLAALAALVGGALSAVFVVRSAQREARERVRVAQKEAAAIRKAAEIDAATLAHQAENQAREEGLELLDRVEAELTQKAESLARREERAQKRLDALTTDGAEVQAQLDEVVNRERKAQSQQDKAKNALGETEALAGAYRQGLEEKAGTTGEEVKRRLAEGAIEEVRAEAAHRLRLVDQTANDPSYGREAKRLMGISIQRYHGHFLTERLLTNIPIPPEFVEELTRDGSALMEAIQEASGVKLELHETGEKLRLDSGDGVAKEIVRRAINKLIKRKAPPMASRDPKGWIKELARNLDREILTLGNKAFSELEIPAAHKEIVMLVGRLNYRTSYTQNQWKHAMEAAFLGGMMASELGLDVKLARRATLMHDIGKSLTHEIEGSHAVIGADYARRLGEDEVVANAIGAHHAEEPPGSIYAYIVAAADAMSGARPGARREQSDAYANRLGDLERISAGFRGVDRAMAVQGGREVRVYVQENVDDLRAVELSTAIAQKISEDMVFPGQIKVTVIRQFEAVTLAS